MRGGDDQESLERAAVNRSPVARERALDRGELWHGAAGGANRGQQLACLTERRTGAAADGGAPERRQIGRVLERVAAGRARLLEKRGIRHWCTLAGAPSRTPRRKSIRRTRAASGSWNRRTAAAAAGSTAASPARGRTSWPTRR